MWITNWCYYPHRWRFSLSPVCRIFFLTFSAKYVLFPPNLYKVLQNFTKTYQSLPKLTKFTKYIKNFTKFSKKITKFVIDAVLLRFVVFVIYMFFFAKSVSPKSQGWHINCFFEIWLLCLQFHLVQHSKEAITCIPNCSVLHYAV